MNEWLPYQNGAQLYASVGEDDPIWRARQRDRFLQLLKGRTVADIGCGPGFDLAAFAQHGLTTVGIDGAQAMLDEAAQRSPQSTLCNLDLRAPLPQPVDGIWSMFALLHLPESELAGCFDHWKNALFQGGALALGLVESPITGYREVDNWLGQSVPGVFYYHSTAVIETLLEKAGFHIEEIRFEQPLRYKGGVYDEFRLKAYVIFATRKT